MVGPLSENNISGSGFFYWEEGCVYEGNSFLKSRRSFLPMGVWKFVTNHALVLVYLAKHPQMTARELSNSIGITERAVRKIIADLETEGYFRKEKEGRRVRYYINPKLPLRHHTQKDKAIKKLLAALGWKGQKVRTPVLAQLRQEGRKGKVA